MNLKTRSALITDMDGVICDSQAIHATIEALILAEHGIVVTPQEISELFTGKGTLLMFAHYLGKDKASQALSTKNHKLTQLTPDTIQEIPGASSFYREIATKTTLGVASGSSCEFISLVLKAFGSGEEVSKGKPDPAVFKLVAQRLGVNTEDCWTIEDSPFGIQAAKTAGMYAVGITTGFSQETLYNAGADIVFSSFREICHFAGM